jgi:hypothetical protein
LLRDLLASDPPAVIAVFTIRSDNYERLQQRREIKPKPSVDDQTYWEPLQRFAKKACQANELTVKPAAPSSGG